MPKSHFPPARLEEAVTIVQGIEDNNAGRPYNRLDLAKALALSPGSSRLRNLITASRQYGLTTGNYNSTTISLTDLGRSVLAGGRKAERELALKQAAAGAEPFSSVYQFYNQKKLPDDELLARHLLKQHGVPEEQSAKCIETLKANAAFVRLLEEMDGALWVRLDRLRATAPEEGGEMEPAAVTPPAGDRGEEQRERGVPKSRPVAVREPPRVFIAHGKNNKILGQLKDLLEFGEFEPVVVGEEETTAIPVPKKVMDGMHECSAAIINVSADEQVTTEEGETSFKVNENVLIEIGAAFVLYRERVILLVDKRVKLPSNLQGLYACWYEGNSLDFDSTMKLQKALTKFKQQPTDEA